MKQMKKTLMLLVCTILIISWTFALTACNDNQNSNTGDTDNKEQSVVGQQVSETIWNEQIAHLMKTKNLTMTREEEIDEELWVDIYKILDNVLFNSHSNIAYNYMGYTRLEMLEENYYIYSNEITQIYRYCKSRKYSYEGYEYYCDEEWYYDEGDKNVYDHLFELFDVGARQNHDKYLIYNEDNFITEAGVYRFNISAEEDYYVESVVEMKFINNKIAYIKFETSLPSDGLEVRHYYITISNIDSTVIELPNHEEWLAKIE